jgi:hypothetical protein
MEPCTRAPVNTGGKTISYVVNYHFGYGGAGFHMAVNHAYAAYAKYARLWGIQ